MRPLSDGSLTDKGHRRGSVQMLVIERRELRRIDHQDARDESAKGRVKRTVHDLPDLDRVVEGPALPDEGKPPGERGRDEGINDLGTLSSPIELSQDKPVELTQLDDAMVKVRHPVRVVRLTTRVRACRRSGARNPGEWRIDGSEIEHPDGMAAQQRFVERARAAIQGRRRLLGRRMIEAVEDRPMQLGHGDGAGIRRDQGGQRGLEQRGIGGQPLPPVQRSKFLRRPRKVIREW